MAQIEEKKIYQNLCNKDLSNPQRYNRKPMFLLDNLTSDIGGSKLPTNKQVLSLLFYYTRNLKTTVYEGCKLSIDKVKKIWAYAGVFTLDDKRCIQKLQKIHEEYRNVSKNAGVPSNQQRELEFSIKLDTLFDIAHSDVFQMVSNDTKFFLMDQRSERQFHLNFAASSNIEQQLTDDELSRTSSGIRFELNHSCQLFIKNIDFKIKHNLFSFRYLHNSKFEKHKWSIA